MKDNQIYLIGKSLSSSYSYKIHNAIYKYIGLDYRYANLEYANKDNLYSALSNLKDKTFISNITYPYKKAVFDYFNKSSSFISPAAKFCSGCNFIICPENKIYNFDGQGLINFLQIKKHNIDNNNILICGSGITAHSIYFALSQYKNTNVFISSRTGGLNKTQNINYIDYSYANKILENFDIIIDTTPLSTFVQDLIDITKINNDAIFVDVNYSNNDSMLIKKSFIKGLLVYNGIGMLVCQAILSIQEICKYLNVNNNQINDFEKMYNLGIESLGIREV